MKDYPDINDTLRSHGVDGVLRRHDKARKFNGDPYKTALPDAGLKFSADARNVNATKPNAPTFPLIGFEEIRLNTERRGYLIKGLLPDTGLAVIWGPPKCYKSFWAIDVGLHIALGKYYRGRRSQQAAVVYVGLEGRHGLPSRIEAFKKHHRVERAPFYLMTRPLNLTKQVDVLIADIDQQLDGVRPGVVFIDTLNCSLAGSESKDEDMAAYLAAAGKIEEKFNCLVVIVHHCGIDGTRPRGHTSLSGAVEVQLAVKRTGNCRMVVTVELAKDMPEGVEIFSRLQMIDLGTDPDGDPIASFIVLPAEAKAAKIASEPELTKNQRSMLSLLRDAGPGGLTTKAWNDKAKDAGIGAKRKADLYDIRGNLKDKTLIYQDDGRWIAAL